MRSGARVVVVVPAFEEAPRIGRVIAGMPSFVDDIVVVDDASRDGTAACAREIDPRVTVLEHAANRGVGAAIVTGYRWALATARADGMGAPRDAFAVMAGDGQMDPADLAAVVDPVIAGVAGYVKGNRFLRPETRDVMPRARQLGGRMFSRLTAGAIGVSVDDSQSGYTAIARQVCAALDLDGLWPRYGYPNDLLGQLAVRQVRIAEVPVRAIYAAEVSKLRARHTVAIAGLVGRAFLRRHGLML
jgi:glycosyltransferase involved in cell wall biosynthesis